MGFLERVVVTPRARPRPRRPTGPRVRRTFVVFLGELIPRRRIGLSRFSRFVSKSWPTRPVGHSSTCTSDLYRRRVRLSRLSPSASLGRAAQGRAAPGSYRRPAGLWNATGGKASAHTDRAGLGHATGGRAPERDQASAHTTGPGFGTPLAQLMPRRRIGLCRRFPRFLQQLPC